MQSNSFQEFRDSYETKYYGSTTIGTEQILTLANDAYEVGYNATDPFERTGCLFLYGILYDLYIDLKERPLEAQEIDNLFSKLDGAILSLLGAIIDRNQVNNAMLNLSNAYYGAMGIECSVHVRA